MLAPVGWWVAPNSWFSRVLPPAAWPGAVREGPYGVPSPCGCRVWAGGRWDLGTKVMLFCVSSFESGPNHFVLGRSGVFGGGGGGVFQLALAVF